LSENPHLPPELEHVLDTALQKDADLRYQHASDIKADLVQLQRTPQSAQMPTAVLRDAFPRSRGAYWKAGAVSLLGLAVVAVAFWQFESGRKDSAPFSTSKQTAVAVLPFQNTAADHESDFLQFALPDEIASTLSRASSISIRPSIMTSKYVGSNIDVEKAARDLRVKNIVSGHYFREGKQLQVSLELIDISDSSVIWQDTVAVASTDLIAMREQITAKVLGELLPRLGVFTSTSANAGTRPTDAEAYDLYLRGIALSHDVGPNREAIAMLERSVGKDSKFAPAWDALGLRYYYDLTYGTGGEMMRQKAVNAYARALALDPRLIQPATQPIIIRLEQGKAGNAYGDAQSLVNSHPDSAEAHFLLAFVLRYAGAQDRATQECDKALALDPGNFLFRSCFWAFAQLGEPERARDYIKLDAGSEWQHYATAQVLLREGKLTEAKRAVEQMSQNPRYHRDLLETCFQLRPSSDLDGIVRGLESAIGEPGDPEPLYYQGSTLAFCGRTDDAVRLLRGAIQLNYCSYSALLSDPLLSKLRQTPEFDKLLMEGKACQDKFLAGSP
jgi:TolB-like protein